MTEPKSRAVIMTAESVNAILQDLKSQTRRVMNPQPTINLDWVTEWGWTFFTPDKHISGRVRNPAIEPREIFLPCPYALGQRLYVKETWRELIDYDMGHNFIAYRADGEILPPHHADLSDAKWKSPRFMPRWASRITLEIASVRAERIQSISEIDCEYELGVEPFSLGNEAYPKFRTLWNSVNAKRGYSFESNCYVWAIAFRRVQP